MNPPQRMPAVQPTSSNKRQRKRASARARHQREIDGAMPPDVVCAETTSFDERARLINHGVAHGDNAKW